MNAAAEQLKPQLLQLPNADRAALARFLMDSLGEALDPHSEAAWEAELARRADEIRSGHASGAPAERVFAELRKQYS